MTTHILVCNDDLPIGEKIALVLERGDCHVHATADASEALRMIQDQPGLYDLLLTDDKTMPINALDLVRELRAERFLGKIIVLASRKDTSNLIGYIGLEVDQVVFKPFDFIELRNTVSVLLSPQPAVEKSFIEAICCEY